MLYYTEDTKQEFRRMLFNNPSELYVKAIEEYNFSPAILDVATEQGILVYSDHWAARVQKKNGCLSIQLETPPLDLERLAYLPYKVITESLQLRPEHTPVINFYCYPINRRAKLWAFDRLKDSKLFIEEHGGERYLIV